jgi:hypothetical protein
VPERGTRYWSECRKLDGDYAFKATGVDSIEPEVVELEISLMADATDAKEMVDGFETAGAGAEGLTSFFSSTGVSSAGAGVDLSEALFMVMITASESDSSAIVTSCSSAQCLTKGWGLTSSVAEESLTTSGLGGAGADKT